MNPRAFKVSILVSILIIRGTGSGMCEEHMYAIKNRKVKLSADSILIFSSQFPYIA